MRTSASSITTAAVAVTAILAGSFGAVQPVSAAPTSTSQQAEAQLPIIDMPQQQEASITDAYVGGGAAFGLLKGLWSEAKHLATWRLVQTSDDQAPYWTTELGKQLLFYKGVNFMDVTASPELPTFSSLDRIPSAASTRAWPTKPAHKDFLVEKVFANVSEAGPRATLKEFTTFRNRYYRSQTGLDSQRWLLDHIRHIAKARKEITVREFKHEWQQNSIILHWPSSAASDSSSKKKKHSRPTVILGAHLDSTAFIPFMPAPGADDDGSGTATIVEALRALIATGWAPSGDYDLEFHWYSAEEGGLLGSQAVVKSYVEEGREVRAMLQQDMTAFFKPGTEEKIALVADFTDDSLTAFIAMLVDKYLPIPSAPTKIGYAASDHASWTKAGVPSAFVMEGLYDDCNLRNIHTGGDLTTADGYSFQHMLHFIRLTTAFAVELVGQKA